MLNDLIRELRHRRVMREALVYVVCAGIGILVLATAFPLLGLPAWSVQVGILGAVLGLPIALALSWVFDINNGAVERTQPQDPTPEEIDRAYMQIGLPGRPQSESGRVRLLLASSAILVTVVTVTGWLATTRQAAVFAELDDTLVVVLPFGVADADAVPDELRFGLVELIAARMTGPLQPVDPHRVIAAFGGSAGPGDMTLHQSRALAAGLRAGTVLVGDISGSDQQLIVSASLVRTRDGRSLASAQLPGRADSVAQLMDRLVAALHGGLR